MSQRSDPTSTHSRAAEWLRALRVHQWLKNVLVFLPLLLAHRIGDMALLARVGIAFVAFCACASATYVLNDLLDVRADRAHVRKRLRPFASGALQPRDGWLAASGLLLVGAALAFALRTTPRFALVLGLYCLFTVAYSIYLKRIAILDVMCLAGLYTLRIFAGGAAADIAPSFWLLAFSMFIFLSLAIVKRYTELETAAQADGTLSGRAYGRDDAALLLGLGPAAGFVAVLVIALYINSPESLALYGHPKFLWLLCPLILYWVTRVWFLTKRGHMHDDPVVFAATDPTSLVLGALCALLVRLAV
jgi:4-hydroxybenzoate polyprenyltransferase